MTSMSDSGTCACRAKPEILQLLFQTTIKTIRKLYKAIIPLVYKILIMTLMAKVETNRVAHISSEAGTVGNAGWHLIGKDPHHNLRFRMRQTAVDRLRHNYILYIYQTEALMSRCQTSRNVVTAAFVKGYCCMSHRLYLGHSIMRIPEVKLPISQDISAPSLRQ